MRKNVSKRKYTFCSLTDKEQDEFDNKITNFIGINYSTLIAHITN